MLSPALLSCVTLTQEQHARLHAMTEPSLLHVELRLDRLEANIIAGAKRAIEEIRDDLLARVRRQFDATSGRAFAFVRDLELRKEKALRDVLAKAMQDLVEWGQHDARSEVPVVIYDSVVTITPASAIRAMRSKAFWVTGVLSGAILTQVQGVLVAAIENGEAIGSTMTKLREVFLPYLGDENIVKGDKLLTAHRLETIVRTNIIDAYNRGRLQQIRANPYVLGARYSAILDSRTTQLCEDLHTLVFHKDDPDLDILSPPNHYNCRSILTPITITQKVPAEKFATARDVALARSRMLPSFGGDAKYEVAHG